MEYQINHQNITWLNHKQYEELPYYLSWFDICFLPLKNCVLTKYINPCKLWEYMASEKEIIKTNVNIECSKIIKYEDECEKILKLYDKNLYDIKYNAITCYVINMVDDIEKFNICKTSLNNTLNNTLNIVRFDAIVGKNIMDRTNYFINCDEQYLNKYTNGQIGCFLSHMNLIHDFYFYSTEDYCLICEDDVELCNLHNLNIYQIIDNAPTNWEKIRLSYILNTSLYDDIIKETSLYLKDNFTKWTLGTNCYIINKKGAQRVLELFKNKKFDVNFIHNINTTDYDRFAIDKWLFYFDNDYIFKYLVFTYNNISCSNTNVDTTDFEWSNNSKKYIYDTNLSIQLFNPEVSIILPTYNGLNKLSSTIMFILNQSFKNFELIIIIDGSTDGTLEFLTDLKYKLKDERIHIVFQKNKKLPNALNEGLIRCRGKYITWTSDDNYMLDNNIEEFYNFLENNNNIDFVYSGLEFFGEKQWTFNRKLSILDFYFNYPGLASFMWTKKIIQKIGYYNTDLSGIEDYDYILRTIELNNNVGYINKILYRYKFDTKGDTMTSEVYLNNKIQILNEKLWKNILDRNNGLPNLDILFYNMSNISNEEKTKLLKKEIINCQRKGVKNFILKYVNI